MNHSNRLLHACLWFSIFSSTWTTSILGVNIGKSFELHELILIVAVILGVLWRRYRRANIVQLCFFLLLLILVAVPSFFVNPDITDQALLHQIGDARNLSIKMFSELVLIAFTILLLSSVHAEKRYAPLVWLDALLKGFLVQMIWGVLEFAQKINDLNIVVLNEKSISFDTDRIYGLMFEPSQYGGAAVVFGTLILSLHINQKYLIQTKMQSFLWQKKSWSVYI